MGRPVFQQYPLYVAFYPSAHFSRLPLDGLRPTGGLQGTGSLCTSPGVVEALKLSGTVYGGWSTTNDALMESASWKSEFSMSARGRVNSISTADGGVPYS